MKKKGIFIIICTIVIIVIAVIAIIRYGNFGSRPDGSTDVPELSEIGELVLEKAYTQEKIEDKLKGVYREDILHSWGEPAGMLSGFWGEIWFLDEEETTEICLYYDSEGYVENVRIRTLSDVIDKLTYGDTALDAALGLTKDDVMIEEIPGGLLLSPDILTVPPTLHVVCAEERIKALKGTYSWEYQNDDGTATAVEADSMHPLEGKEHMEVLPLSYKTYSALPPLKAYLQFDVAPDEVEIRYWSEDCWNDYSAESQKLEVQVIEVDLANGGWTVDYSANLLEGNYIYEVIAKWTSSEQYSGTVHYSFYTAMGEYEPMLIEP